MPELPSASDLSAVLGAAAAVTGGPYGLGDGGSEARVQHLVAELRAGRAAIVTLVPPAGGWTPQPGDRVRYVGDRVEWSDLHRARAGRDSLVVTVGEGIAGLYDPAAEQENRGWGAPVEELRVVARAVYAGAPA